MNILDRTTRTVAFDDAIAYWQKAQSRRLAANLSRSARYDTFIKQLEEMKAEFLRYNPLTY